MLDLDDFYLNLIFYINENLNIYSREYKNTIFHSKITLKIVLEHRP
jgi:hypothetical protein